MNDLEWTMENKVTYDDIRQWIERFQNIKKIVYKYEENGVVCFDPELIEWAMNDALYLVALVESLLSLEEPDGVLDRALELQGRE